MFLPTLLFLLQKDFRTLQLACLKGLLNFLQLLFNFLKLASIFQVTRLVGSIFQDPHIFQVMGSVFQDPHSILGCGSCLSRSSLNSNSFKPVLSFKILTQRFKLLWLLTYSVALWHSRSFTFACIRFALSFLHFLLPGPPSIYFEVCWKVQGLI